MIGKVDLDTLYCNKAGVKRSKSTLSPFIKDRGGVGRESVASELEAIELPVGHSSLRVRRLISQPRQCVSGRLWHLFLFLFLVLVLVLLCRHVRHVHAIHPRYFTITAIVKSHCGRSLPCSSTWSIRWFSWSTIASAGHFFHLPTSTSDLKGPLLNRLQS